MFFRELESWESKNGLKNLIPKSEQDITLYFRTNFSRFTLR